jgi:hypothetical protein
MRGANRRTMPNRKSVISADDNEDQPPRTLVHAFTVRKKDASIYSLSSHAKTVDDIDQSNAGSYTIARMVPQSHDGVFGEAGKKPHFEKSSFLSVHLIKCAIVLLLLVRDLCA